MSANGFFLDGSKFFQFSALLTFTKEQNFIMAVSEAYMFPGFLTPVLTQLFFSKAIDYFSYMLQQGLEAKKYAGKKVRLNLGSNSQPPGHESDTLTTEPPRQGLVQIESTCR